MGTKTPGTARLTDDSGLTWLQLIRSDSADAFMTRAPQLGGYLTHNEAEDSA
jgi:hypothetical protein